MLSLFAALLLVGQNRGVPSGGTPVVAPDSLRIQGDASFGRVEWRSAEGAPFSKAIRAETFRAAPNAWQFEVLAPTTAPIAKGDVVLATVWLRTIRGQAETGEARTLLDVQTGPPVYAKSVSQAINVPKAWKRFDVPFVALDNIPAGEGSVAFRLGYGAQVVELGGLTVLNFGKRVALRDLPRTRSDYQGQEANAPWRKTAEARIDRIRKGDLTVQVVDAGGKPLRGANVELHLTKHAFPFGTAVGADELLGTGPDSDRYRQVLKEEFNRATIENHLKWPYWETWGKANGIKAVDWLDQNGISVRAHNVIWPSWRNSPPDLRNLDNAALRKRIDDHIVEVVGAMKGKVDVWDVVNEPFANHDILDKLGWDEMPKWFSRVHEVDPHPTLVLNDYPTLDGASHEPHLEHFFKTIGDVKRSGAPIGGIGFQCHFGGEVVPPERILSGLDRFATFGLPIEITEFDMNTSDEDLQSRYMRDFLTAVFSHPSVSGVIQWGFWSKRHWLPAAALYDDNWNLRPHGKVYLDLIKNHWTTRATGRTSSRGELKTRGFFGDYAVTVTAPGKPAKTVMVRFVKGASGPLRVSL